MMTMNLFILFTISIPEAFLSLIIILLLIGEKNRLKMCRSNLLHFMVTLSIMVSTSWFICTIVSNVAGNFITRTVVYTIIISIIYRVNILKTFLSILVLALFCTTLENTYYPLLIEQVCGNVESYYTNILLIAHFTIPMRLFQIGVIIFLWKYHVIFALARLNKGGYGLFVVCIFIITFSEYYFSYGFVAFITNATLTFRLLYTLSLISMVLIFNPLLIILIYSIFGEIMTKGFKQYQMLENHAEEAFYDVYTFVKNNEINEATRLLEVIIGKTKTND